MSTAFGHSIRTSLLCWVAGSSVHNRTLTVTLHSHAVPIV